jgi:TolA-binding protein
VNASRDQQGGRSELALKEYTDYLQLYGDTDKASEAQYNIGQIHWEQGDMENAVKDFDAFLERYPSSGKTPDAMFKKGQALVKVGRKTDGQKEFKALLANYPRHELASKACGELKAIGYNCTVTAASKKKGD